LTNAKVGSISAKLTIKDKTGKTASATLSVSYSADAEKPVLSYVSLEDNALQNPLVRFMVSGSSSVGLQGYRVQLDKEDPQFTEGPAAVNVELANLAPGPHTVTVTALDLPGRESDPIKRSFRVVGPAPQMGELALKRKSDRSIIERAGTFSFEAGAFWKVLYRPPTASLPQKFALERGRPRRRF